jgi:NAD(P)H dehydrogenase (quinone)
MYGITGITGQVGSVVGQRLLEQGERIRAVVRDPAKGEPWIGRGAEGTVADLGDAESLGRAFTGLEGVFILVPPSFAPVVGFPEARRIAGALRTALLRSRPGRVVCLSTIGAQVKRPNLLNQLGILEQALETLPVPVAFLRAAWFMENAAWDVGPARKTGVVQSHLQPLDQRFPMVSVEDVGGVGAELLQQRWSGKRIVELEGPNRVSPRDIGAALASLLGRDVRVEAVPREAWQKRFEAEGNAWPEPRIQMLDGFNEGWIEFEGGAAEARKGAVGLADALKRVVERA